LKFNQMEKRHKLTKPFQNKFKILERKNILFSCSIF